MLTNKEQSIQKLKVLIEDFKANHNKYKSLSEADVETKLVEELFVGVLGWSKNDFEKRPNVKRGDKRGIADYSFKIGEKILFFLEVKKVGIPLDKEADKQVVSYALSKKNVSFAISTNFEQMKIFCVEEDNAYNNTFRVFRNPDDYLTKIRDLFLLSKESFEKNELLQEAEAEGRLKKRSTIDKVLLEDLMEIRRLIANDIEKKYPSKYNINEQDEIVQRIIDRLIFIRRAEDIGIQPNDLRLADIIPLSGDKAYPKLKAIFKEYDLGYNSGLFDPNYDNDCDKIIIDGETIKKLICLLYESKKGYIYNFDWIDADVLGQVYEQYLGKILAQTKSGKVKLKEGQAHRKEQGIYYTPTYIVDYIVENTIGEILKDKKINPTKIKILDPACGSGSFLIKAYDYLANHIINKDDNSTQHRLDEQGHYSVKTEILKNNIYGVDLDQKAVEITKLNLLLKAAEKNRKLPKEVDLHIRHGNSLIDDEIVSKYPFKWEKDFQEGTFDVVIGNPPYVKVEQIIKEEKEWIFNKFKNATGRTDLYILFLEKALNLVKEGGFVPFIVPSIWFKAKYGEIIRQTILKNYQIATIIDFGDLKVFENVTTYPCIIIIKSNKPTSKNIINYYKVPNLEDYFTIHLDTFVKLESKHIKQSEFNWNFGDSKKREIFNKISNSSNIKLSDLRDQIYEGFITGDNKAFFVSKDVSDEKKLEKDLLKPVPKAKNIRRYSIKWDKEFVIYPYLKQEEKTKPVNLSNYPNVKSYLSDSEKKLVSRKSIKGTNKKWFEYVRPREKWWFEKPKILTPNLSANNNFAIDEGRSSEYYYVDHDAYAISIKSDYQLTDLSYLCGILNSKVIEFFIKQISPMFSGGYYKYHTQYLDQIPVVKAGDKIKSLLVELVSEIISLNKKLLVFGDKNTSETSKIKEEIKETDNEINELVYELYNITEAEKKIIEDSLNKNE